MARGLHHHIQELPKLQKEIITKAMEGKSNFQLSLEYGIPEKMVKEIKRLALDTAGSKWEDEVREQRGNYEI